VAHQRDFIKAVLEIKGPRSGVAAGTISAPAITHHAAESVAQHHHSALLSTQIDQMAGGLDAATYVLSPLGYGSIIMNSNSAV
jgi:hypothetical protein